MKKSSSSITESLISEFQDKETRHIYADDFLNTRIATQIKVLREQRGWKQNDLAEKSGMKQARISVLEDVNYDAWTLSVLRRLAEAFDLRISVSFEEFGTYIQEFSEFNRVSLERESFINDAIFQGEAVRPSKPKKKRRRRKRPAKTTVEYGKLLNFPTNKMNAHSGVIGEARPTPSDVAFQEFMGKTKKQEEAAAAA